MADEVVAPVVPPVVPPAVPPTVPVVPVVPEVVTIPEVVPPVVPKPTSTGNAVFDTVQDALYEKGIDAGKYWEEVSANGKVTPESRAALVEKMGEAQVKLLEQGVTDEFNRIKANQQVEAQKVYDQVNLPGIADGKAAFETIASWAKSNVTPEERTTLNEMLAKGGVQATLAIKSLRERYMADPSYSAVGNLTSGDSVPAAQGPELISRSTYVTELRKAENARDKVAIQKLHERAKHTMATNAEAWRP